MKKYIIYIVILSSLLFSIGLDGVKIPYENSNLSLSSTGVASENNIFLNPAAIHTKQKSSVGFSYNRWIQELNGSSFFYLKDGSLFSFTILGADDIEIRNEIASEDPIDIVSANLMTLGFSRCLKLNNDFYLGFSSRLLYSQTFNDKIVDAMFGLGAQKLLINKLKVGILIENFGSLNKEPKNNFGLGLSYLATDNMEILTDIQYTDINGAGFHLGLIQSIKNIKMNLWFSNYSNKKTTYSSGVDISINDKINFNYSLMLLSDLELGLAHYFGLNFIL